MKYVPDFCSILGFLFVPFGKKMLFVLFGKKMLFIPIEKKMLFVFYNRFLKIFDFMIFENFKKE